MNTPNLEAFLPVIACPRLPTEGRCWDSFCQHQSQHLRNGNDKRAKRFQQWTGRAAGNILIFTPAQDLVYFLHGACTSIVYTWAIKKFLSVMVPGPLGLGEVAMQAAMGNNGLSRRCMYKSRGSVLNLRVWFLGPESLNIGYLDPLGQSLHLLRSELTARCTRA